MTFNPGFPRLKLTGGLWKHPAKEMAVKRGLPVRKKMLLNFLVFLISLGIISTSLSAKKQSDDSGTIKQRTGLLGISVGKITKLKDGSYEIEVKNFRAKTRGLTKVGTFKPFLTKAKVIKGKLYLEKDDFAREGFSVNTNNLPETVKIEDLNQIKLMNLNVLDQGIRRIEIALAEVRRYKTAVPRIIAEVRRQVNETLALFENCPLSDPNLIQPALPLFSVNAYSEENYLGGSIGSCNHYPENAEIAKNNAKHHLDYVGEILSTVNSIKNFIDNSYKSTGLSDTDKSNLQKALSNLKNQAQAMPDTFDRLIEDIVKFLEDYKECIEEDTKQSLVDLPHNG